MKYIETYWLSIYSDLWVKHSGIVDWDRTLSYEMLKPLWLWVFKIYDTKEYLKWKLVLFTCEIKDFPIAQYEWRQFHWLVCFEALEVISNWDITMLDINQKRVKILFNWAVVLIFYWVAMVTAGMLIWIYWFTVEPENFISTNKDAICQELEN